MWADLCRAHELQESRIRTGQSQNEALAGVRESVSGPWRPTFAVSENRQVSQSRDEDDAIAQILGFPPVGVLECQRCPAPAVQQFALTIEARPGPTGPRSRKSRSSWPPSFQMPQRGRRVPQRESQDAAAQWWASVQLQQLDAMVAAGTDEQLSMAFGHREVSVTAAEFGGSVNDHDGVSKAKRACRLKRKRP